MCAAEVLLYGLKDWWIRERKKGLLDPSLADRPDCPDGQYAGDRKSTVRLFLPLIRRLGAKLI
jgi:E3 ubiquitin-protein ligase CHFR